jgi:adenosine deaminase
MVIKSDSFNKELKAINAALEASAKEHEDRPLDFVDLGSGRLATAGVGLGAPQQLLDTLELTHFLRLTGIDSVLLQRDIWGLLSKLKTDDTLVMIALPSANDLAQSTNSDNPFMLLRASGVPVAFTADPITSGSILANSFCVAASDYKLSYEDLKALAYTSTSHTLLPQEAKDQAKADLDAACAAFEQNIANWADAAGAK